jgi:hypothetical protein
VTGETIGCLEEGRVSSAVQTQHDVGASTHPLPIRTTADSTPQASGSEYRTVGQRPPHPAAPPPRGWCFWRHQHLTTEPRH